MEKDFDTWNIKKKELEKNSVDIFTYPREIWWCSLGVNIGIETDGKNNFFERPVLVVKVFNKNMIWCLPLTSTLKDSSFYYPIRIKNDDYSVMISQLRTISSKRLLRKEDMLGITEFDHIITRLKYLFDYNNETTTQ